MGYRSFCLLNATVVFVVSTFCTPRHAPSQLVIKIFYRNEWELRHGVPKEYLLTNLTQDCRVIGNCWQTFSTKLASCVNKIHVNLNAYK